MRGWTKESALSYISKNQSNKGLTFQSAKDYLNHYTNVIINTTKDGEVLISER